MSQQVKGLRRPVVDIVDHDPSRAALGQILRGERHSGFVGFAGQCSHHGGGRVEIAQDLRPYRKSGPVGGRLSADDRKPAAPRSLSGMREQRCLAGSARTDDDQQLARAVDGPRNQPIELLDLGRAPGKSHRCTVADPQRTLASAAARAVNSALDSPAAKCSSMAAR